MKIPSVQIAAVSMILFSSALLTGCATSFKGDDLPSVKTYPIVFDKKSASVELLFSGKLNGKPWKNNDAKNTEYLKKKCIETMIGSNMFGPVTGKIISSDLSIQVAVINERTTPGSQLPTILTLYLYPYKTTDTFKLLAIVKDNRTGRSERIAVETSVNYYQQLLLTPLALFKSDERGLDAGKDRLLENLCLEIKKAGFLD